MNEQSQELLHLERYIVNPIEDLDAEYKGWLDLSEESHRATLAKAVIALANHGAGVVILGFEELSTGLAPRPKPAEIPDVTHDAVNSAVRRYVEPQPHCQLHLVKHPNVGSVHPVIRVPGGDVPIMSKRDQSEAGLRQHKVYVRKPGPRSEEPQTEYEWRTLLDRCVRARREELLDSIRGIVLGRVEESNSDPTAAGLEGFMDSSRANWITLVQDKPVDAPYRFPNGHYEVAIAPGDLQPAISLSELKERLAIVQRVQTSGWPPFMDIGVEQLRPYASGGSIEAWIGRPLPNRMFNDPSYADFWRASPSGQLFTMRGYWEDSVEWANSRQINRGAALAINFTVNQIWECLRFASRFMRTFGNFEEVIGQCRYTGLSGRTLIDSLEPAFFIRRGVSQVDEVQLTGRFTLQQLEDNMPGGARAPDDSTVRTL